MQLDRREMLKMTALGAAGMLAASAGADDAAPAPTWHGFVRLSSDRDGFQDSPALAADGQGSGWAVWLARDPGDRERLLARRLPPGEPGTEPITAASGSFESPAVVCLPDGSGLAVCVDGGGGGWRLMVVRINAAGASNLPAPGSAGKPAHPVMASSPDGSVWLAWEAWSRGYMRICLARFDGSRWSQTKVVAGEPRGAYDPAIVCDRDGRAWVAWAGNDADHQRSIYLAAHDPDLARIAGPIAIARGGVLTGVCALNSHPSVACDGAGRPWVAWEHDGATSARLRSPQTANWIGRREVSAVCWDGGRLYAPEAGKTVFGGHNDHMPLLLSDRRGGLVALSRASQGIAQPGPGLFEDRRTWDLRMSRLTPEGWSAPETLLAGRVGVAEMGRLHPPCAALLRPDELMLAWQADTYMSPEVVRDQTPPSSWINGAALTLAPGQGAPRLSTFEASPARPEPPLYHIPRQERRQVEVEGSRYTVVWGNCHEHTLLSRCWGDGSDATPDEDYRYGYDIEGYDFIAMTDHCFDSWEPVWRCTRRTAAYYNDPPHLVANPAYEWTAIAKGIAPSSGHRNIVLASDAEAVKMLDVDKVLAFDRPGRGSSIDQVWAHMRRLQVDGVTIPHHTADADHTVNWDDHDPEYQTAVEIFQCRLSCEHRGCPRQTGNALPRDGAWVWDALARGHRMGFVASGDHNSMGMGRTALLVREFSQAGVVEALRARRCFATTGAPIYLDFRVDGHLMGSEFVGQPGRRPTVAAHIEGTAPLQDVVIIKNCSIAHAVPADRLGGSRVFDLAWTDDDFDGTPAWYYLRVVQTDNQIAWASPVWVDVAPPP